MNERRNPVEKNVMDAIAKRWSPRAFSSQPISKELLTTLFEAARWSPSSYNEQPWRFVVATNENLDAYETMLSVANDWNRKWARLAPVLILTLAYTRFSQNDKPNPHAKYDLGSAVAYLSLEATRHDLYLHQMAGILPEKAREIYAVPDTYEIVSLIALGYCGEAKHLPEDMQANETRQSERKALSELVFENQFGKSASSS